VNTAITFQSVRPNSRRLEIVALGPRQISPQIVIQKGRARDFAISEASGAFSLKWIPHGAALYRVEGTRHRLAGHNVLLLNAGQPYELEFAQRTETESFCLFFTNDVLGKAWASLTHGQGMSDSSVGPAPAMPPAFPNLVFRPEPALMQSLASLRRKFDVFDTPPEALEEQVLLLLERLILVSQQHRGLAQRIPAGKPRTRQLVLRRLLEVRQLIEETRGPLPTLDELAAAGCLSKFHMLRLFKATFGVTPLRYAESCRIGRATPLLKDGRMTINEVAATVGYESQSAFTRSFRRNAGVTPATFRNAANRERQK
jgi:AraC-like DNA-binding protein